MRGGVRRRRGGGAARHSLQPRGVGGAVRGVGAAGAVRDGGSYEQRMGGIACWNALMDENTYMVQKWNEFVAA